MATQIQRALVILRLHQVKARTGLSRSGIYQKMTDGEFPRSVALGLRAVGWVESDIDHWLASKVQASRLSQGA
jgi:prophage regulatory protein